MPWRATGSRIFRTYGGIVRLALARCNAHDVPRVAAALAFYATLSLAPMLVLAVGILALAVGHSSAQDDISTAIAAIGGPRAAATLKTVIDQTSAPFAGGFAAGLNVVAVLFGASSVFSELEAILNKMCNVEGGGSDGIWTAIWSRVACIGMVFAAGALLLVSTAAGIAVKLLADIFVGAPHVRLIRLHAGATLVSLATVTVVFALILRYVPSGKITWRRIWAGATVASISFALGNQAIGFYLSKAAVGSAYGAAASVPVILVWIYYSAILFLFGAEFTGALDSKG